MSFPHRRETISKASMILGILDGFPLSREGQIGKRLEVSTCTCPITVTALGVNQKIYISSYNRSHSCFSLIPITNAICATTAIVIGRTTGRTATG